MQPDTAPADAWTLTVSDVAAQLGVHADTVKAWEKKGLITCWRTPGGTRRFRQSDVDAFVALGRS